MTMNSLKGKNVVFTGTLCSMKREEAIELAIENGARIQNFVTEETDILVLAPRQLDIFGADVRSRKLIKAEELRKKSDKIKIISEKEFLSLLVK
ncbi:BRCT domain-containing protein [Ligilactobacillus murinus]|nr:BRCT domain-containing protein [Ligilactobacillus murinus]WRY36892.1 BRCT domain-containing protein [Ligilactobacillus murinus]